MNKIVIIPTYNEKNNIEGMISQVLSVSPDINLLVMDDNSPDGTGKIVDSIADKNNRVSVIHREKKLGLGTAYITGFRYAIEHKYDYIFTMDADFSHKPGYLIDFIKSLENYDFTIGSRYVHGGGVVGWPPRRKILSKFGNFYARTITGLPIKDCTSGFSGFRRNVLENIDIDKIKSEGYGFLIELKYRSIKKGFKPVEIPIIFYDRTAGKSKISRSIILEAILLVWKLRIFR